MIELTIFLRCGIADDDFQVGLAVTRPLSAYQDESHCRTAVDTLALG